MEVRNHGCEGIYPPQVVSMKLDSLEEEKKEPLIIPEQPQYLSSKSDEELYLREASSHLHKLKENALDARVDVSSLAKVCAYVHEHRKVLTSNSSDYHVKKMSHIYL
jgi:hypothetical protein